MAAYSPSVEKWRPLAEKYFPPDVVDKVLYVINGESGGNATIPGDGGAAYGLFQSHYIKPGASPDAQFADAARLYKANLQNGGTGFGDWGEGTTYQGKPFGSLGNHPYGGSPVTSSTTSSPSSTSNNYSSTDADFQQFLDSYLGPKPQLSDFTDQPGYPASAQLQQALTEYAKQAGSLSNAWANVRGPTAKGVLSPDQKIQQAIDNKIKELDLQVRAGQIDAQAAASNLSAFVQQQTNAISLTKDVANAKDQEIKYGLGPSGKTNFSYADMGGGAAALAKAMGVDPNSSNISYTGATTLDPEGDYARIAGGMGVGGLAPTVNPHMMATVSQGLDEWGRPTSTAGTDTGSTVGTGFGGIGSAVANAGSGFINPGDPTLPPGYGSTAGLGDATTPQNAITPTPSTTPVRWGILGGVPILPPAKVGVR
jgi:hypothetical protein